MFKKYIFYILCMGQIIQAISQKENSSIQHIRNGIDNRINLHLILQGINDIHRNKPYFELLTLEFQKLQSRVQPLITTLPELKSQLTSYEQNPSPVVFYRLLLKTVEDDNALLTGLSDLCALEHKCNERAKDKTAEIVGVNKNTAQLFFHKLRNLILKTLQIGMVFQGEVEADE